MIAAARAPLFAAHLARRLSRAAALGAGLALVLSSVALAPAALAHSFAATRSLRLQLEPGGVEGLLSVHLGARQARVYGVRAGGAPTAQRLAGRLAPEALRGLSLALDGAPLDAQVAEARGRPAPDGAIDAALLVRFAGVAVRPGQVLQVSLDEGGPLPIQLIAPSGQRLALLGGAGTPIAGGLALHPRKGAACTVRVEAAPQR